jgi:hypothetical protein
MKERLPCPRAFNDGERMFGFVPDVLAGVFVVFALLMILPLILPISWLLPVLVAAVAFTGAYWYSRFELEIKVFVRAFFQSPKYTPEKRTVVRLEIK